MVILGYRYQSYSLVDMRVQDINVVADLNRNDPNSPNPTEPVRSDGTPSGQGDNAGGTQGVDTYLVEALQFMYSQWILISFWPALNYVVPGLDGNLRPSTSAPALISFAVDLLSAITVFSMSIVDFAFSLAQIDAGTLIGWIAVELAKDFFVVATFTSLYIGAYAAFRAADGFRIAQAYPAMAAAILAGGALFAAALALVEGFNMVGAIAGMENFWSMMFFLVLFLSCLSSALKGLPGNPVINALIAKGDNLVYWICMKLSIDLLSITDWNPVISCITGVFLLLTCVFFWFRFLRWCPVHADVMWCFVTHSTPSS
ncbi:MAG: hypothetical protein HXY34_12840 [Candidatus Thorarchaeota archaeon]|nr:hypothetical protein [Candidatus Thorarchaeota archaeon]